MGYDKGKLSRNQIVEAASAVILKKGFDATSLADLSQAAQTSAGKLTHHFPTKSALFEAVFQELMCGYKADPLTLLSDLSHPPRQRIEDFFDAVSSFYEAQCGPIGCPLGHAAGDTEGVSPAMQQEASSFLEETEAAFEKAFLDLGHAAAPARAKAIVFVSAWQGAVVVARAGRGIAYIREVFDSLISAAVLNSE